MGIGCGLYMYDVVVKRSRSLSHLLMSTCYLICVLRKVYHIIEAGMPNSPTTCYILCT